MNKYISKLFGVMFQNQQTQQVIRVPLQQSPTSPEEWCEYWQAKGFPWRTEPEIDAKRQEELSQCRIIVPDIEKGNYPFKGVKLNRADVEWLLATYENGRGPVDWSDESQRERKGLDLRGADLRQANLSKLPLTCMRGSLDHHSWREATEDQRLMAYILLTDADLSYANLEKADLEGVHLTKVAFAGAQLVEVNFREAKFMSVDLSGAFLKKANLIDSQLKHVSLLGADLENADLLRTKMEKVDLRMARPARVNLAGAHLEHVALVGAYLEDTTFVSAHLKNVELTFAQMKRSRFNGSHLEQVDLRWGQLEHADLSFAKLENVDLRVAQLADANLKKIVFSDEKHIGPRLADAQWDGVNLTLVKWSQMKMLGDEYTARQKKDIDGNAKSKSNRQEEYEEAVRANRQLAVALQNQGLNEDAARFAYHAQVLQRKVLWKQHEFGKWFFSFMLALLAGYGYRMWRILVAYLFVILLCATAYFVLGMYSEPHLSVLEAVLTSITAFHGRVFSEPFLQPGEPQLWVTAFEAVAGLVIEGVFIAMLTQKFFGK